MTKVPWWRWPSLCSAASRTLRNSAANALRPVSAPKIALPLTQDASDRWEEIWQRPDNQTGTERQGICQRRGPPSGSRPCKGHWGSEPPTVGDLAGYLLLRPHSAVELVDRAEAAGLVERTQDREDARVVRIRLTRHGDRIVQKLTRAQPGPPA